MDMIHHNFSSLLSYNLSIVEDIDLCVSYLSIYLSIEDWPIISPFRVKYKIISTNNENYDSLKDW